MIFGNLGKAEREILHIGTDSRDLIGPIESKSESENGDDVFSDVRFRCKSAVHRLCIERGVRSGGCISVFLPASSGLRRIPRRIFEL